MRGDARDVEARDEVEIDDAAECVERMRAILRERARGDAAAGGVDAEVDTAERPDGLFVTDDWLAPAEEGAK